MELGYISKAMDIDKENEISNHQYNKMRRKHRKELIKLAKKDQDLDYEYLHMFYMEEEELMEVLRYQLR